MIIIEQQAVTDVKKNKNSNEQYSKLTTTSRREERHATQALSGGWLAIALLANEWKWMENGIGWQMESNGIESNGMDTGKPEKSRYDEMNRYHRWNIND